MSSIKFISVGKRTRPVGAPDERVRPRYAHAAAVIVRLSLGPAFARDTGRKMHAVLLSRGGRRRGIASYRI
jgi:hypothetical protein